MRKSGNYVPDTNWREILWKSFQDAIFPKNDLGRNLSETKEKFMSRFAERILRNFEANWKIDFDYELANGPGSSITPLEKIVSAPNYNGP